MSLSTTTPDRDTNKPRETVAETYLKPIASPKEKGAHENAEKDCKAARSKPFDPSREKFNDPLATIDVLHTEGAFNS